MRIAYVAGFFGPVEKELKSKVSKYFDENSVVWIPQRSNRQLDLSRLKSDLFRRASEGARDFLICAFIFRGQDFLDVSLDAVILSLKQRHPEVTIDIIKFKNARDVLGIASALDKFGPTPDYAYPASLVDIESWCLKHYSSKILLHPRAIRGAKESEYSNVELAYKVIRLLAEEYREMKTASIDSHSRCSNAFANKLDELGVQLSPAISASRAGEQGDEYKIIYPVGGVQKVTLDLHIKKGVDRDPRNCLRLYFYWDDSKKFAVVGWMTSHLDTRNS